MEKVIIFDIDGTIYSHKTSNIYESTKEVLIRLKEEGYIVGFITGRSKSEMKHMCEFFNNFNWDIKVYEGGAIAYLNNKLIIDTTIDKEDINRLVEVSNINNLTLRYTTNTGTYFNSKALQYIKDIFFRLYLFVPEYKKYDNSNVYNILIYYKTSIERELILNSINNSFVMDLKDCIEVCPTNVNKANTLEYILSKINYTLKDVIAFGDGYNDVEMIKRVSKGIAVGNAVDKLKEVAYDVCESIHNDGIAKYINKHILK